MDRNLNILLLLLLGKETEQGTVYGKGREREGSGNEDGSKS